MLRISLFAGVIAASLSGIALPSAAANCLVIAHRGASGYFPEHTLAAYQLAMQQGADYIEPDIVLTRDGVPVARHESVLQLSTDVATRPEFANRKRTALLGGTEYTGWFIEDFSLAELRTLRATERFPDARPANVRWNGEFQIPTLQEVIDVVRAFEKDSGRVVGLYPELKQVAYFEALDLDPVSAVLRVLDANALATAETPVLIQSFEVDALRAVAERSDVRTVLLLGDRDEAQRAAEPEFLQRVADYAVAIGVPKYGYVLESPTNPVPTSLVSNAHAAGLAVHAYTFRAENRFLPEGLRSSGNPLEFGDIDAELEQVAAAGVDGFFIDQPDIGRRFCDRASVVGGRVDGNEPDDL